MASPEAFGPLDTPDAERISDYVAYWAAVRPEAEAAVQGDERLTFEALRRRVDTLARALVQKGVRRGDRVATLAPPSVDFLATFLASASIGAIWLGLNPRHTVDELAYAIADAEPAVIFHRRDYLGRSLDPDLAAAVIQAGSRAELIGLDRSSQDAFQALDLDGPPGALEAARAAVRAEDPAMLVYTSGSTGRPKGALVTHQGLVMGGRRRAAVWSVGQARIIHFLPINHIGGAGDITCYGLAQGGTLVFLEKFEPLAYLALAERERATVLLGIPTPLQMCVEHLDGFDLSEVELVVFGGAAPSKDLVERYSLISPRISTSYGMTESCASIALLPPGADVETVTGSVGSPNPDFELRIANPNDQGVGEVEIRGLAMTPGYWRRPEESAAAFTADGFFMTGDLGRWRADGRLALTGRSKEMFKSGGYNVYPREVELALERLPGVGAAAVVAAPDPVFAEVGVAFVTAEGAVELDGDSLRQACRAELAHYKTPKHVVVVPAFPQLANGKIDKISLKREAHDLVAARARS